VYMNYKNKIFVIFGVSGSGQDSVIEGLKEKGLEFEWVITTSSRPMRQGESEGKPYYFVTEAKFKEMIKEDKFIEWDRHYETYYGCTYAEYERIADLGKIIIWKTDMRGALTIKEKLPDVTIIHIKLPSVEAAIARLKARKQDSDRVIKQREEYIREWMSGGYDDKFDYNVVNEEGKLEETVDKVWNIINSY